MAAELGREVSHDDELRCLRRRSQRVDRTSVAAHVVIGVHDDGLSIRRKATAPRASLALLVPFDVPVTAPSLVHSAAANRCLTPWNLELLNSSLSSERAAANWPAGSSELDPPLATVDRRDESRMRGVAHRQCQSERLEHFLDVTFVRVFGAERSQLRALRRSARRMR